MATMKPKRPPAPRDPAGGKGTYPTPKGKPTKSPPPKGSMPGAGGGKPGGMMPGAPAGRGSFGQVGSMKPVGPKPGAGKKPIPGPRKGR